ncbi:MAG: patatin-like phospholipase family protein, partial [Bradyrhizobium sp.]|nr:patatin-like phospholipase family protein [Bradyrhizobium sp.]
EMANTNIDIGAVIGGILLPGDISSRVAHAYDRVLFKGATLQDLPDDAAGAAPRFVFNATNVQTAALWRFSRPYMGDYRVGLVRNPTVPLAQAVAASSAFPPILSPASLPITQPVEAVEGADLSHPPYTREAFLSDGGVYDNMGLETVKAYKTLLVSDAGQKIDAEPSPHHDWPRHALRVLEIVDNQVRSLRARDLIAAYQRGDHDGCYWGIRGLTGLKAGLPDPLGTAHRNPAKWAAVPTRLEKMPVETQNGLINWGYAACDIALRGYFVEGAAALGIALIPPVGFPVPDEY